MIRTKIALACAAALASVAAHAQQKSPEPAEQPAATVKVTANADSLRRNDTASRTVVTRDEILKYGDQSVIDVLKRLPGVTIGGGAPRMRGLGAGYTQVLVNGERPPAGFSLETLAPDQIEKIEVIRAATAEYSTQAVAGTINVILSKSVAKASRDLKVNAGGSSVGRNYGLNAAISNKDGRLDYMLGANLAHLDNDWQRNTRTAIHRSHLLGELRDETTIGNRVATTINANARVTLQLDKHNTLTWQSFLNKGRFRNVEDIGTESVLGPAYVYPHFDWRGETDSTLGLSNLNWVVKFDGGGKLDTKAGASVSRHRQAVRRSGTDEAGALRFEGSQDAHSRDNGWTWTGKYSRPLGDGHAFATGWDAGNRRLEVRDSQRIGRQASGQPLELDTSYDASVKRLAVYVQDEWDVTSTWSLYLGVRWEGVQVGATGKDFGASTTRSSVPSPLLQSLWKLPSTKGGQVRFAVTRTYRAPELFQLVPRRTYTSVNDELSPDFAGNPNLEPELATGFDTAYEHYFQRGGMVSVSASSRRIDGYIRSTVRQQGERWVSFADNQGSADVRTVELEAKLPLNKFMPSAPQLELRGSLARNWSRVEHVPGPGNRLDRQPEWSANLGADYTRGGFKAGASFSFVSGGWTRSAIERWNYASVQRDLEAYAVVKLGPASQLRFAGLNLLQPGNPSGSIYEDAWSRHENSSRTRTHRSFRVQYELKL